VQQDSGITAVAHAIQLSVCVVIVTGFLGVAFLRTDNSMPVALLFVTAMVTFFVVLVLFLQRSSSRRSISVHTHETNSQSGGVI
jgi:uncharacterized membrane protein